MLLFVGRLAEVKDLPTMLRAFALAAVREPGLRLWIVGDGPVRPALEQLAREQTLDGKVSFWGQSLKTAARFAAAGALEMSSVDCPCRCCRPCRPACQAL